MICRGAHWVLLLSAWLKRVSAAFWVLRLHLMGQS
jgi:hypothetical protein